MVRTVWESTAPIAIASAAASLVLTEVKEVTVVLSRWFGEKFLGPVRVLRRAEGHEEASREWRAWNKRRVDAEGRGEVFTEMPPSTAERDLIQFCRGLFSTGNLIGTDFADATAERIDREFVQDSTGIRVSFTVSNHAIGKADLETQEALARLKGENED